MIRFLILPNVLANPIFPMNIIRSEESPVLFDRFLNWIYELFKNIPEINFRFLPRYT
jgi:hypothetical protein